MLRNLFSWSDRTRNSHSKTRKADRSRRRTNAQRDAALGVERLESRTLLSANPILSIEPNQFFGEDFTLSGVFFRATFNDELQFTGEDPQYNWSIDWQNDGVFDLSGTTSDFEIQTPFGQQPAAGDSIVGRINIEPFDPLSFLPFYTDPGVYTVKLKLNNSVATKTVEVFPVALGLFVGDEFGAENQAFEGSDFTLDLPTHLPDSTPITAWRINWGDAIAPDDGGNEAKHPYADGVNFLPGITDTTYNITAVAFTSSGAFHVAGQYFVEVYDVPGEATVDGDANAIEDTPYTLNLGYIDAGTDSVFKWQINWGDGIIEDVAGGFTSPGHIYENPGLYSITVTATTEEGEEDVADPFDVTVNAAPQDGVFLDQNGKLSVIDANAANDIVTISQSNGSISVTSNGGTPAVFNMLEVNSIDVVLGSGHDVVVVGSNILVPLTIDGGAGNDFLSAGGGPAILIGGPGNDILWGGANSDKLFGDDGNDDLFGGGGNDVLIGGAGNDIVYGGAGRDLTVGGLDEDLLFGDGDEDILIGGTTSYDNHNIEKLDEIMTIWGSGAPFLDRVSLLTAAGELLESGVDVFDDESMDIIIGGAGRDLVFGNTNPADGVFDVLALSPIQDVLKATVVTLS